MIKSYKTSIVPTKIGSVIGKGSGGGWVRGVRQNWTACLFYYKGRGISF